MHMFLGLERICLTIPGWRPRQLGRSWAGLGVFPVLVTARAAGLMKRVRGFVKLAGGECLCAPFSFAISQIQIFNTYKGELGELGL